MVNTLRPNNSPTVSWSTAVESTEYKVVDGDGVEISYEENTNGTETSGMLREKYESMGVYWLVFDKFRVSVLYPGKNFLIPYAIGGRRNTRRNRKNRKQRKSSRRRRTLRR